MKKLLSFFALAVIGAINSLAIPFFQQGTYESDVIPGLEQQAFIHWVDDEAGWDITGETENTPNGDLVIINADSMVIAQYYIYWYAYPTPDTVMLVIPINNDGNENLIRLVFDKDLQLISSDEDLDGAPLEILAFAQRIFKRIN